MNFQFILNLSVCICVCVTRFTSNIITHLSICFLCRLALSRSPFCWQISTSPCQNQFIVSNCSFQFHRLRAIVSSTDRFHLLEQSLYWLLKHLFLLMRFVCWCQDDIFFVIHIYSSMLAISHLLHSYSILRKWIHIYRCVNGMKM